MTEPTDPTEPTEELSREYPPSEPRAGQWLDHETVATPDGMVVRRTVVTADGVRAIVVPVRVMPNAPPEDDAA